MTPNKKDKFVLLKKWLEKEVKKTNESACDHDPKAYILDMHYRNAYTKVVNKVNELLEHDN